MIRLLVEELSRSNDKDFQITSRVSGYWNRSEEIQRSIEIDHISSNEEQGWIRFGSCKRSAEKIIADVPKFEAHLAAFLKTKEGKRLSTLHVRKTAFAPNVNDEQQKQLKKLGFEAYGLDSLLERL